jgi:hypothetical protein
VSTGLGQKWRKIPEDQRQDLMKNGEKDMKGRADRFCGSGGVHRAMKPLSVTQQEHGTES